MLTSSEILSVQGVADSAQVEARKAGVKRKLRERAVPASSIGRAWGFTQLGAGLVFGSASDAVSRVHPPAAVFFFHACCLHASTHLLPIQPFGRGEQHGITAAGQPCCSERPHACALG